MTRENKNSKKTVAVLLTGMIVLGAGITSAYFTDHSAVVNEFTFGNIKSELTETKWDNDPSGKAKAMELRPNMSIVKDPVITNTGTSDSYNFISFRVPYEKYAAIGEFGKGEVDGISVDGQCVGFDVQAAGGIDVELKDLFKHEVNDENWILVEHSIGDGYHEYVYAYATGNDAATGVMTALKKNGKTTPLFKDETINVINLVEDEWALQKDCATTENTKFNIPVRAYSIQTTDLLNANQMNGTGKTDPENVWNIVKSQVNSKYSGMAEANWGNVRGENNGKGNDSSVNGAVGEKASR